MWHYCRENIKRMEEHSEIFEDPYVSDGVKTLLYSCIKIYHGKITYKQEFVEEGCDRYFVEELIHEGKVIHCQKV